MGHASSLIGRLHWEFVIQIESRILPDIKQLQIKSIIAFVDKRERATGRGRKKERGMGRGGSCSAAFEANESTCFCGCSRLQIAGFLPIVVIKRMKCIASASASARSRTSLDSALCSPLTLESHNKLCNSLYIHNMHT